MARRPVKIKRYYNMGDRYRRRIPAGARVLLILLAAAAIFGIGWFVAPHCIDFVTEIWYENFSVNRPDSSSSSDSTDVSDSQSESAPESQSQSESQQPVQPAAQPDEQGTWGTVALSAFGSEETLREALSQLAQAGVTHAQVTLKDERGYLYYDSAVELAVNAGAVRANADIELFAQLCAEYGLQSAARVCVFRDPLAAYARRTMAVQFRQAGVLWLDTSQELGGKPWLDPYSLDARQYILDITAELHDAGITDVVFAGVQFPSGYALEVCHYSEDPAVISRTECLRECVALLQGTLEERGQRAWFLWPASVLGGVDELVYGSGPAAYGALRVLLDTEIRVNAEGVPLLPECDEAALAAFVQAAAAAGTQRFGLGLQALASDAALAEAWQQTAEAAGFTHFHLTE